MTRIPRCRLVLPISACLIRISACLIGSSVCLAQSNANFGLFDPNFCLLISNWYLPVRISCLMRVYTCLFDSNSACSMHFFFDRNMCIYIYIRVHQIRESRSRTIPPPLTKLILRSICPVALRQKPIALLRPTP